MRPLSEWYWRYSQVFVFDGKTHYYINVVTHEEKFIISVLILYFGRDHW